MNDPIFDKAKQLQPIVPDDALWSKIEDDLIRESQQKRKNIFQMALAHKSWLSVAAVLIISFSYLAIYFNSAVNLDAKLLSTRAILKVELTEKNYMEAIALLEKRAENQLGQIDNELMFLYRDKLAMIDTQINQCREAISKNPGNAHIRKYMLAALQDKKHTLTEIINLEIRGDS